MRMYDLIYAKESGQAFCSETIAPGAGDSAARKGRGSSVQRTDALHSVLPRQINGFGRRNISGRKFKDDGE